MVIYSKRSPSACSASCPLWASIPRYIHPPYTLTPTPPTHTNLHVYITTPGASYKPREVARKARCALRVGSTRTGLLSLPARWRWSNARTCKTWVSYWRRTSTLTLLVGFSVDSASRPIPPSLSHFECSISIKINSNRLQWVTLHVRDWIIYLHWSLDNAWKTSPVL